MYAIKVWILLFYFFQTPLGIVVRKVRIIDRGLTIYDVAFFVTMVDFVFVIHRKHERNTKWRINMRDHITSNL